MAKVTINLYGKLRKVHKIDREVGTKGIIEAEITEGETLDDLLARIGISRDELYTIFVNSKLLTTKNKMADHLAYQQYCEDCHNWELCVILKDGDNIALFGLDMATLVI